TTARRGTGASKYRLQVNTAPAFEGTALFNTEVGNNTNREVTGLSYRTKYYWWVKAGKDGGWRNSSAM
ncbi:MAG: hypothetical protein ABSB40_13555, partial [Nitrososphaeria archaeon]